MSILHVSAGFAPLCRMSKRCFSVRKFRVNTATDFYYIIFCKYNTSIDRFTYPDTWPAIVIKS